MQSGRTPLQEAVLHKNNAQVVEILVKAGADVTIIDKVRLFSNTIACLLIITFKYYFFGYSVTVKHYHWLQH